MLFKLLLVISVLGDPYAYDGDTLICQAHWSSSDNNRRPRA